MRDLRGYLEWEDVKRLINAPDNLRDRLILRILAHTGCRVSELLALERKDVLWGERILIFRTLKRREKKLVRRVPVDAKTLEMLHEYLEHRQGGRLFPISRVQVFRLVKAAGERIGIHKVGEKSLHPHHLRHSFAVRWVKAGLCSSMEGLRKLQMFLGHADVATTAYYLQFSPVELRAEYDKIFEEE